MEGVNIIPSTATKAWADKKCQWCGRYIQAGDELVIVVPDTDTRRQYKRLASNYLMHKHEFHQLIAQCNNAEEVYAALGNHPTPRAKSATTDLEKAEIAAIEQACRQHGFYIKTQSGVCYRFRARGSSKTIEYNYKTKKLRFTSRAKEGLLSGIFEVQLVQQIGAEADQILGRQPREVINANKVIEKVVDDVNGLMGGK